MSERRSVELLTRENCPLCERAEAVLERWAGRLGLEVVRTDVDADAGLQDEFGGRVPVVRGDDGRVLAEGRIGAGALVRALTRYRGEG